MSNTFDDLFNEFFKRNNINPEDKISDALKNHSQEMMSMLTQFQESVQNELLERQIHAQFGKPDKSEFYNDGNLFFEKRTWYTSDGPIVKTIVTTDPSLQLENYFKSHNIYKDPKKLEAMLKAALSNEEYEKAAAIRDEIKKIEKK